MITLTVSLAAVLLVAAFFVACAVLIDWEPGFAWSGLRNYIYQLHSGHPDRYRTSRNTPQPDSLDRLAAQWRYARADLAATDALLAWADRVMAATP